MPYVISVDHAPSRYRCCNCFHVRTGTLILAIFQIIIHFVIIAILVAALGRASPLRNDVEYIALSVSVTSFIQWERFSPETYRKVPHHSIRTTLSESLADGNATSSLSLSSSYPRMTMRYLNYTEECLAIALTFLSLLFSIMLLVGTVYGKPKFLLPYVLLQFFDLFITCLSVVSYFSYLPSITAWLEPKIIFNLLVILAGVLLLSLKAYLLAVVWLCYKFLNHYQPGSEQASGFNLVYGSRLLPSSIFQRWNCLQIVSHTSPVRPALDDQQPLPGRSTHRPLSRNRLLVLLRQPSPTASEQLASNCLPPKYEDVLAMPHGLYDPPPYEEIAEAHVNRLPEEFIANQPIPGSVNATDELNNSRTESGDVEPPLPLAAPLPMDSD